MTPEERFDSEKSKMLADLIKSNARLICVKDVNVAHGSSVIMRGIESFLTTNENVEAKTAILVAYNHLPVVGVVASVDDIKTMSSKVGIKEPIRKKGLVQTKNGTIYVPIDSVVTLVNGLIISRAMNVALGQDDAANQRDSRGRNPVEMVLKDVESNTDEQLSDIGTRIVLIVPVGNRPELHADIDDVIHNLRLVDSISLDIGSIIETLKGEERSDAPAKERKDDQRKQKISEVLESAIKRNVYKDSEGEGDEEKGAAVTLMSKTIGMTVVLLLTDSASDVQSGVPTINTSIGHTTNLQDEIVSHPYFRGLFKDLSEPQRKVLEETVYADIDNTAMISKIPPEYRLERIGGYDVIKDFITYRRELIRTRSKEIAEHGIILKGLFMFGVPGCGKTTLAMCVGNEFGAPAYLLNIDMALNRFVGDSEDRMRQALTLLEQRGRVVVVIDEIDKIFAGVATGQTGSDVPIRLFGILLQFMARENGMIFVVTANALNMKDEFMRKGRFDRIFFIDVPPEEDRRKIVDIYAKKFNIDRWMKKGDSDFIVSKTGGFTGADIESLIKEVTIKSIMEGDKKPDIRKLINKAVEVSKSAIPPQNIEEMRKLAADVADNEVLMIQRK